MEVFLSDSNWDSTSESDSSEDPEENEYFYGGQASCILSSLEESIGKIDEFLSFERVFILGDVVHSTVDPSGQMGRVVGMEVLVDLENGLGTMVKDVNSKRLLKIRSMSVGDLVVYGPWLGRVDKVIDCVTVVFDDGTKCKIIATEQEKIVPIFPNTLEDSQYPYYPGQRVKVQLSGVSKSTRWLCGSWTDNEDEGTICAVEAGLVYVDWLDSVLVSCGSSLPAPQHFQKAENLTLLSCFSHANWQLGDWCFFATDEKGKIVGDEFLTVSTDLIEKHKKFEGFKAMNIGTISREIFAIVKTKTKVDVVWQDGSCSFALDSKTLLPSTVVSAHEFWPEQFVLEKGISDDSHNSNSQRLGIVQAVDAREKTVKVRWKAISESVNGCLEATMSSYELVAHPHYSFSFGDVVFRVIQTKYYDQADNPPENPETEHDEKTIVNGKNNSQDNHDSMDYYLSCIGQVTGFRDASVEVKWADGSTSKVEPHEICRVDKNEDSTTIIQEENVEEMNQEITEHEKEFHGPNEKDLNCHGDGKEYENSLESSRLFHPRSVIGLLQSIARSLYESLVSTSASVPTTSCDILKNVNEPISLREYEGLETSDNSLEPKGIVDWQKYIIAGSNEEATEITGNEEMASSRTSKIFDRFQQFDIVKDCSDHNLISSGNSLLLSQMRGGWLQKVQQEWSILENHLPGEFSTETIFVRVFEERMDLLRAVIVGAAGTPYHDGAFFFDIFLPPGYPHEPPLVHYISGGLRLNPNLYESGKVCLSLLNTWTGTGTEVWNPGSSTILQVLLSLQALVLNEKPYFNEAGFDKQVGKAEGERNSLSYNENAFLITCKSILYLLRKPPMHFDLFIQEHFQRRAQHILLACRAYMEGAPVGFVFGSEPKGTEKQQESSTGFKIMLAKLLPKLVEAFTQKGIDCSQYIEPETE